MAGGTYNQNVRMSCTGYPSTVAVERLAAIGLQVFGQDRSTEVLPACAQMSNIHYVKYITRGDTTQQPIVQL